MAGGVKKRRSQSLNRDVAVLVYLDNLAPVDHPPLLAHDHGAEVTLGLDAATLSNRSLYLARE
jgi:hypothetical protein